ncbi:hypothetical protein ABK040_009213 [Willaertia magna]
MKDSLCDRLPYKITHVDSGEVFSIIRDEHNRYWYCGKSNFARGNECCVTFVVGGKHAIVCVDETLLYSIGTNFESQLGIGTLVCNRIIYGIGNSFKEIDLYGFKIMENQDFKLCTGTFNPLKKFGIYFENEFKALEFKEGKHKVVSIETDLPIVQMRLSEEITLVFYAKLTVAIFSLNYANVTDLKIFYLNSQINVIFKTMVYFDANKKETLINFTTVAW